VYNPAFIALGDVVKGFEEPDYVLLGEVDDASGDIALDIHRSMTRIQTPIARMSPVEAEITKIASNTHETMRVSFANMLLSICAEVPGANVDRITDALAHRMGKRFFRGAVPYGGPCWPRDNRALAAFMDAVGVPSRMPRTVDLFNEDHGRYVLRKILELVPAGARVGILGLAYKPGTPVLDESFSLRLARWLVQEGRAVCGWDPLALDSARRLAGTCIDLADTAESCMRGAQAVIISIPLAELRTIDWSAAAGSTVIDCWRCLPREIASDLARYVPLGRGPDGSVAEWLERSIGARLDLLVN
jgi:UDPglucose 6-dehydrogenase